MVDDEAIQNHYFKNFAFWFNVIYRRVKQAQFAIVGVSVLHERYPNYDLSPLASRLSPLASRLSPLGILAALLVFMPLLCLTRPALADDWAVTYSPANAFPASDNKLCDPNTSVTATKTVTITATLTWTGTGTPPSRIVVDEAASVSWSAEVHRAQNGTIRGTPPPDPSGSVSKGNCSTGLTDVITENPDQTDYSKGQSIVGTREQKIDIPASGTYTLPPVTLTASATATSTGLETTGSAAVTLGGYSVSVPNGSAHASASFDLTPGTASDWSRGRFIYAGPDPNGTTFTEQQDDYPKISVDLASAGMSELDKTVLAIQFYESDLVDPDPLRLYGTRTAEGSVSSRYFTSSSSVGDSSVSGEAPNTATGLSYNAKLTTYPGTSSPPIISPSPTHTPSGGREARYEVTLKAKASTAL